MKLTMQERTSKAPGPIPPSIWSLLSDRPSPPRQPAVPKPKVKTATGKLAGPSIWEHFGEGESPPRKGKVVKTKKKSAKEVLPSIQDFLTPLDPSARAPSPPPKPKTARTVAKKRDCRFFFPSLIFS
jgi:hypothetical protein